MENASKALLIAASVLIVILLIAVGMRIFNSTSGTADNVETTMNATEIATFNSKFTAYAGTGKSASQVRALANIVIANNATNQHEVSLDGETDATGITQYVADLEGTYNIVMYDDDENGLIDYIVIE